MAPTRTVLAACPHDCPDTCSMLVRVDGEGRAVEVAGNPEQPVTAGSLCGKVSNYLDRVYAPDQAEPSADPGGSQGLGRISPGIVGRGLGPCRLGPARCDRGSRPRVDPTVIKLADHYIREFARNQVRYSIQYHADQKPAELKAFWSRHLEIDGEAIDLQRKSNSGQLAGRTWRSKHGVLTVRSCDTMFRARLEAWMDLLRASWL